MCLKAGSLPCLRPPRSSRCLGLARTDPWERRSGRLFRPSNAIYVGSGLHRPFGSYLPAMTSSSVVTNKHAALVGVLVFAFAISGSGETTET